MSQHGWADCPPPVRAQVSGLTGALSDLLAENLVGVYLHGSLATGCFNPERSDVDMLAVVRQAPSVGARREIGRALLRYSAAPRPIEFSLLRQADIDPWRYPTPFDFHFGEEYRARYTAALANAAAPEWQTAAPVDPDLAAHIAVTLQRGLGLVGQPAAEVFAPVPPQHFMASVVDDFHWGRARLSQHPDYFVLNACRVWAYLQAGKLFSKEEGGRWARRRLPEPYAGLIAEALRVYAGAPAERLSAPELVEAFADYMAAKIQALQES